MKLCRILSVLFFLLLFSCSQEKTYKLVERDGVEHFSNNGKPSNPNLKIFLTKLFEINGTNSQSKDSAQFTNPTVIDVDKAGNIYILDTQLSSVKKFSQNGKFITTISRNGKGPGETQQPVAMFLQNDTLCILNHSVKQIVKHDCTGNFITNVSTKKCYLPVNLHVLTDKSLVAYLCNWRKTDKGRFMDYDLALITNKYDIQKYFYKQAIAEKDVEVIDYDHPFTIINNKLAIAFNDKAKYKIECFDDNGNKTSIIEKKYRIINFSKDELNSIYNGNVPVNAPKQKNPVNRLLTAYDGRLIAAVSVERQANNKNDYIADVFNNGIFENRIKIDIPANSEEKYNTMVYIFKNRLYLINTETAIITVYEYKWS